MPGLDQTTQRTYAVSDNANAPARLAPPGAGHEELALMSHEGSHDGAVA